MAKQLSQTALYGELLTNEQQLSQELQQVQRLTREEEQELLLRVHDGDTQAREILITSFTGYIKYHALRMCRAYRWASSRIEYLDLFQEGNLAVLETFDRALQQENPIAYLLVTIRNRLYKYCQKYASLIITPQEEDFYDVKDFSSFTSEEDQERLFDLPFEALSPQEETEEVAQHVQKTLHMLGPKQREVIARLYGLCGYFPHTLQEVTHAMNCTSTLICNQRKKGFLALQKALSNNGDEELYTIQEACEYLQVGRGGFNNFVRRHDIKPYGRGCYRKQDIHSVSRKRKRKSA